MRTHATLPVLAAALLLAVPFLPAVGGDEELKTLLATIEEEDCKARILELAAPDKVGRYTLSNGFERAAVVVEAELEALGLEPVGDEEGSYRRHYPLQCLVAGRETAFSWSGGAELPELELERDFLPVPGSGKHAASGEAVFVGYAIDAAKERWSDLARKDVEGRVVFAFTREPRADDPKEKRFEGVESTEHSSFAAKARAVAAAGGVALVLVPDPGLEPQPDALLSGLLPMVQVDAPAVESRMRFPDIPVLTTTRAVAGALFGTDLDAYHAAIDKKRRPSPLLAEGATVSLRVDWASESRRAVNLAARLKGSGESGKVLVIGAHLDHVGLDLLNGQHLARGHVFPGADDNASGSATLLEVAEALVAGGAPQIDILFLWFSGEELGLLGSRGYCEAPAYPHADTIAMFNMDMVGRGEPKELNIGGLWSRPEWADLVEAQNKRSKSGLKLDLKSGRDLYARSDQYSFHQKEVPGLFFFEGNLASNKVYHQPGDVPQDIDAEKMARIARCVTACAYAVAFEGERPE